MYLKLPLKLHNLSGYPRDDRSLTSGLSKSLLSDYCDSCNRKSYCKIKKKLEKSVADEETFQDSSLVLFVEPLGETTMDFYTDDEITKREDGYYEASDGTIFTLSTRDDEPIFPVCILYQSTQRPLPELEPEHPDFIYLLLEQYH